MAIARFEWRTQDDFTGKCSGGGPNKIHANKQEHEPTLKAGKTSVWSPEPPKIENSMSLLLKTIQDFALRLHLSEHIS